MKPVCVAEYMKVEEVLLRNHQKLTLVGTWKPHSVIHRGPTLQDAAVSNPCVVRDIQQDKGGQVEGWTTVHVGSNFTSCLLVAREPCHSSDPERKVE